MSFRSRLAAATGLALAVSGLSPQVADGAWRWPVRGVVTGEFAFSPRAPFAGGRRRGLDIATRPRAIVGSACSGRVTFAGRLPGRGGGVTVLCGRIAATHLGLGVVRVGRGARVAAGAALGRAGPAGVVRLGARIAGRRFGYVDPRALIGRERAPRGGPGPLGPAPGGRPRAGRAPPRAAPAPVVRVRSGVPARRVPLAGWAGLALLAGGLPLGALARRRRRLRSHGRHRPAGAHR